jgi:hypothetical protein
MTEEQRITIRLLKLIAKKHFELGMLYKAMSHIEAGEIQAAQDSIPPDSDPPDPPGSGDDHDH